jgi:glycosyltransferase involved in cell wall biosynthesis
MKADFKKVKVLYSFPHKLGANRICQTAWQQVKGLSVAGADVLVFPGVLYRPLQESVRVNTTLSMGKFRIPYKVLGTLRACALHDFIVARRLEKLKGQIDIVHVWPLAALQTLKTAASLGIPTVLERPNTHTRYGYTVVQKECEALGLELPPGDNHAFNADILTKEEEEYQRAYRLLCPSEFVVQTFLEQGFTSDKLVRHIYGYDEKRFYPDLKHDNKKQGLTVLFAGVCGVVKGLHYALEAWLKSPAHRDGSFLVAGEFVPGYAEKLSHMLSDPSVQVLGPRSDIDELMRRSDILILPSITEGFGLVCAEAMGSGCVPLVSNTCTDICRNMENSLVHPVGDIKTITEHINMLNEDRALLNNLRAGALKTAPIITWEKAGERLLKVYSEVIEAFEQMRANQ